MTLTTAMTEDALLQAVVEALQWHGWLVHHIRRSDKALQQGTPGFPDIVAARQGRPHIFLELKREDGKLTDGQAEWWLALNTGGADIRILRPSGLDAFLRELA